MNIIIFALSGAVLAFLLLAKHLEVRKQKQFFIFRLISRSDERVRELSHRSAHMYSVKKEELVLFVRKQLPMKVKSHWYKFQALARATAAKNLEKMRNMKILQSRRHDISEFFRSIDGERGAGEINHVLDTVTEAIEAKLEGFESHTPTSEPILETHSTQVTTVTFASPELEKKPKRKYVRRKPLKKVAK